MELVSLLLLRLPCFLFFRAAFFCCVSLEGKSWRILDDILCNFLLSFFVRWVELEATITIPYSLFLLLQSGENSPTRKPSLFYITLLRHKRISLLPPSSDRFHVLGFVIDRVQAVAIR